MEKIEIIAQLIFILWEAEALLFSVGENCLGAITVFI